MGTSNFGAIQLEDGKLGNPSGTPLKGLKRFTPALDVASVAANTSVEQLFPLIGLLPGDVVIVNKPSLHAGLIISTARVSAADTLAITFGNTTGAAIDPSPETYQIVVMRF